MEVVAMALLSRCLHSFLWTLVSACTLVWLCLDLFALSKSTQCIPADRGPGLVFALRRCRMNAGLSFIVLKCFHRVRMCLCRDRHERCYTWQCLQVRGQIICILLIALWNTAAYLASLASWHHKESSWITSSGREIIKNPDILVTDSPSFLLP